MKRRFRKLVLVFILATAPLSLAADRQRVQALGQKFICVCGTCNQLLTTCNHFGCPSSGPMMAEIAAELDEGKTDDSIISHFAEKYGLSVLSAPPRSGFNLIAWIMPFAALLAGAMLVVYFVRQFRAKWAAAPAEAANVDVAKYQQKVEEELKKFTPED
ncbi:MAG TPA: cytochrome c-type biogenesis protein CcmH [Terriglobia bacterium]|nr:cytochrome c-type biogenesis protein CcmH [Terriglobia bacterium]